ncbi:hypothetical protein BGZ70_005930 [Mortierella alpina]|uniref:Uncharacterized protein n=1 Tax=Mortierella alpina TaxID=64518 RepID=A0A9P6IPB6_MORAP|nr:hypothetical protein BGZ70_005930 [Mortierella alpina]
MTFAVAAPAADPSSPVPSLSAVPTDLSIPTSSPIPTGLFTNLHKGDQEPSKDIAKGGLPEDVIFAVMGGLVAKLGPKEKADCIAAIMNNFLEPLNAAQHADVVVAVAIKLLEYIVPTQPEGAVLEILNNFLAILFFGKPRGIRNTPESKP